MCTVVPFLLAQAVKDKHEKNRNAESTICVTYAVRDDTMYAYIHIPVIITFSAFNMQA